MADRIFVTGYIDPEALEPDEVDPLDATGLTEAAWLERVRGLQALGVEDIEIVREDWQE